jgi:Lon protease-like protein
MSLVELAIFPLPQVQLFPHALLPLHVFEPRYRDLVRDTLAPSGSKIIGMVELKPGYESDYEGRPPVEEICGVGKVIAHEPMPDGRCNLLLRGLYRARIRRELDPSRSYRTVQLEPLADLLPPGYDADGGRETLVLLSEEIARRLPQGGEALRRLVRETEGASALADVLAAATVHEPADRRTLLAELDVSRRVDAIAAHLGAALSQLAGKGPAN